MRDFRDNKAGKFEFKYRKVDPSKVKERATQSGGKYDQMFKIGPVFSPKSGNSYRLRIMPPGWENTDGYKHRIWVHSNVVVDNQRYICLQQHKDEPCPNCEETAVLQRNGDNDPAYKLKAKARDVCFVIDRDAEDKGPQIWAPSWTVDRDIAALCVSKRTGEVLYIDDPDNGFDIEFDCVDQGGFPQVKAIKIDRSSSPLADAPKQQRRWLRFVTENPIPDLLVFYEYDHIKKVLEGGKVETDDDDSDDEKPSRGIPRSERQARRERETPDERDRREKAKRKHLADF